MCMQLGTLVNHRLDNILKEYGTRAAADILVKKLATSKFAFYKPTEVATNNGPQTSTLRSYLLKVDTFSRCKKGKSKENAQCAVSAEIQNIDGDNGECLEQVIIDTHTIAPVNPDDAKEILRKVDVCLLVNIATNQYMKLDLLPNEREGLRKLRECRRKIVHTTNNPEESHLRNRHKILVESLKHFYGNELPKNIADACDSAISLLNSQQIADDICQELRSNISSLKIYPRQFNLPQDESVEDKVQVSELCNRLAHHTLSGQTVRVEILGGVGCGRTYALISFLQHWAVPESDLAKCFSAVLPLVHRPHHSLPLSALCEVDRRMHMCLQQWIPDAIYKYGYKAVHDVLTDKDRRVLVLDDRSDGYFCYKHCWPDPCVYSGCHDINNYKDIQGVDWRKGYVRAHLLPLSHDEVEEELNFARELFSELQDKKLLLNPRYLQLLLREFADKVNNCLDLSFMERVVSDGNQWVKHKHDNFDDQTMTIHPSYPRAAYSATLENQQKMWEISYNSILSNSVLSIETLPFLPCYLSDPAKCQVSFRSLYIGEYLAALHVFYSPDVAAWLWLRQTPRFLRVFKFVLQMWLEKNVFVENRQHFRNFLVVTLELYRYNRFRNNREQPNFCSPRPANWQLEDEGFERDCKDEPCLKNWGFISHVFEASGRHPSVLQTLFEVMAEFTVWRIDVKQRCDFMAPSIESILKLYAREQRPVVTVRLLGSVGRSDALSQVTNALKHLRDLSFNMKVVLYYDHKDERQCSEHFEESLQKLLHNIIYGKSLLTHYTGPFLLDSFENLQLHRSLVNLRYMAVTVYDYKTLLCLMSSCPPSVTYLSLSVDITNCGVGLSRLWPSESELMAGLVAPHCRIRFALRYHGSFAVLSMLRMFKRVHVLRLHGLYAPDDEASYIKNITELESIQGVSVDCLFVKFVRGLNPKERKTKKPSSEVYYEQLIKRLAEKLPNLSRVIVYQLPIAGPDAVPSLVQELRLKLPQLQRLILHNSNISVSAAARTLRMLNCGDEVTHQEILVKPRLSETQRSEILSNKPKGFELMFINFYSSLSSSVENYKTAENVGGTSLEHALPSSGPETSITCCRCRDGIEELLLLVQRSSLVYFCFCDSPECDATSRREDLVLRRLLTGDFELQLHLVGLSDKVLNSVDTDVKSCNAGFLTELLPTLAAVQYLRLTVGALTPKGFQALATLLRDTKIQLLHKSFPLQVADFKSDPFHLTVVCVYSDALLYCGKRNNSLRHTSPSSWEKYKKRNYRGVVPVDSFNKDLIDRSRASARSILQNMDYIAHGAYVMLREGEQCKPLCEVRKVRNGTIYDNSAKIKWA